MTAFESRLRSSNAMLASSESSMDAYAFLGLLGDRHTFQTFDDSPAKRRELTRVLHGSLAEHANTLAAINARGAGVFVMVNAGDGVGRRNANVLAVRALFVDLDGAPLEPVKAAPLAPSCIVETSPGRWHAYWLVSDCATQDFKQLQKMLAMRFGGDAKVCDIARVMRLPGFDHRKGQPFRARIVDLGPREPYATSDVQSAFGPDSCPTALPMCSMRAPQVIVEGKRNSTLFDLGRGFVKRGHDAAAVRRRLQRINAERCQPPLCASEVDNIAASASASGSKGFALLPHGLLDSRAWKCLRPSAHTIILRAFRRFDGRNNGRIALPFSDFEGLPGFANSRVYYRHRASVVDSGIIIRVREGRQTRDGKEADLFAIAEQYLHRSEMPKG